MNGNMARRVARLLVAAGAMFVWPAGASADPAWEPAPESECRHLLDAVDAALGAGATAGRADVALADVEGRSCRVAWNGSGLTYGGAGDIVEAVMRDLPGWTADPTLDADGPTGMSRAFRQDDGLLVVSAEWMPPEGSCPDDAPIGGCNVATRDRIWSVSVDALRRR